MRIGHPPNRKLQAWLEGGQPNLDAHLRTCERCATRLETIGDIDSSLREALLHSLKLPEDLPDRLNRDIEQRMSSRSDLLLVGELFGVPFRTARVMTKTRPEES